MATVLSVAAPNYSTKGREAQERFERLIGEILITVQLLFFISLIKQSIAGLIHLFLLYPHTAEI